MVAVAAYAEARDGTRDCCDETAPHFAESLGRWLLSSSLLFALLPAAHAQLPLPSAVQFSWERVQPFFHEDNVTGPYSDEAIRALAKFPLVTLEKWHGACEGWEAANTSDHCPSVSRSSYPCCEEDRITSDLQRVKALNPNVTTIM